MSGSGYSAPHRPSHTEHWGRRPGRQFDLASWRNVDTRHDLRHAGAPSRGWLDAGQGRGHGTPPPPRDWRRRDLGGGGGPGETPSLVVRLLDLLAVGFRYGAPWAWIVYAAPTSTEETSSIGDSAH